MTNVTFTTSGVTIFVFKGLIAYLEDKSNLEILLYLLRLSDVLRRKLIIKYFVG